MACWDTWIEKIHRLLVTPVLFLLWKVKMPTVIFYSDILALQKKNYSLTKVHVFLQYHQSKLFCESYILKKGTRTFISKSPFFLWRKEGDLSIWINISEHLNLQKISNTADNHPRLFWPYRGRADAWMVWPFLLNPNKIWKTVETKRPRVWVYYSNTHVESNRGIPQQDEH